ncbi:unnamed protein product [Amoebophrya sp. A120]|nr:unnamed protein product [Amoebophrya sp. A120]|eukprot:GSA120T00025024001.1
MEKVSVVKSFLRLCGRGNSSSSSGRRAVLSKSREAKNHSSWSSCCSPTGRTSKSPLPKKAGSLFHALLQPRTRHAFVYNTSEMTNQRGCRDGTSGKNETCRVNHDHDHAKKHLDTTIQITTPPTAQHQNCEQDVTQLVALIYLMLSYQEFVPKYAEEALSWGKLELEKQVAVMLEKERQLQREKMHEARVLNHRAGSCSGEARDDSLKNFDFPDHDPIALFSAAAAVGEGAEFSDLGRSVVEEQELPNGNFHSGAKCAEVEVPSCGRRNMGSSLQEEHSRTSRPGRRGLQQENKSAKQKALVVPFDTEALRGLEKISADVECEPPMDFALRNQNPTSCTGALAEDVDTVPDPQAKVQRFADRVSYHARSGLITTVPLEKDGKGGAQDEPAMLPGSSKTTTPALSRVNKLNLRKKRNSGSSFFINQRTPTTSHPAARRLRFRRLRLKQKRRETEKQIGFEEKRRLQREKHRWQQQLEARQTNELDYRDRPIVATRNLSWQAVPTARWRVRRRAVLAEYASSVRKSAVNRVASMGQEGLRAMRRESKVGKNNLVLRGTFAVRRNYLRRYNRSLVSREESCGIGRALDATSGGLSKDDELIMFSPHSVHLAAALRDFIRVFRTKYSDFCALLEEKFLLILH